MKKKTQRVHLPLVDVLSPVEVAEKMQQWFQMNSHEIVGTLSKGTQPHENFFAEFHIQAIEHPFLQMFVTEMLQRQPHKQVLGSQAYRYLRIAVLTHLVVDSSQWPNYAI